MQQIPTTRPRGTENIKSVEWKTERPLAVGTQVAFVATFLGRRLAYTYEVMELVPGERLVMSTADGPFAMETTYTWQDTPHGSTRMTLRNRGDTEWLLQARGTDHGESDAARKPQRPGATQAASRVRRGQVIAVSNASHTRGMFAS